MISVTKDEAALLRSLFPEYKITRTVIQDSHRHHYYATEKEEMMRAIAGTNQRAAELVAEFDASRNLRRRRNKAKEMQ